MTTLQERLAGYIEKLASDPFFGADDEPRQLNKGKAIIGSPGAMTRPEKPTPAGLSNKLTGQKRSDEVNYAGGAYNASPGFGGGKSMASKSYGQSPKAMPAESSTRSSAGVNVQESPRKSRGSALAGFLNKGKVDAVKSDRAGRQGREAVMAKATAGAPKSNDGGSTLAGLKKSRASAPAASAANKGGGRDFFGQAAENLNKKF